MLEDNPRKTLVLSKPAVGLHLNRRLRSQGVHDLDAVIKPFRYDPCILSYLCVLLAIYLFPAIAKIVFSPGLWILLFVLVGLTFLLCASIRAPGSVRIGHA